MAVVGYDVKILIPAERRLRPLRLRPESVWAAAYGAGGAAAVKTRALTAR